MKRRAGVMMMVLAVVTMTGSLSAPEPSDPILADDALVERVAGGFQFLEGPVWHPDGYLLFSDIPANTIYRWSPGKPSAVFRKPSGNANGNTLDSRRRLVTCEHGRRVSITEPDGRIRTLVDSFEGKKLNSPNDLAIAPDGSIYFTDPPYGISPDQSELRHNGVYRLSPTGKLTLLTTEFTRPNGIAFSPDGKRLYVNDSQEALIRVYDVANDGSLTGGRLFAELRDPPKPGGPDGMKVDTRGNVYSTGPGGIWVFSPAAEVLARIPVPEPAANLAFGDKDYKTLYITARTGLYRVRLLIAGTRPDRPFRK